MARTKPPTNKPPRLIRVKAAADEYGIAYTSLRDIVHRGEIPIVRVGRAWYMERSDIDRWIESRKERFEN